MVARTGLTVHDITHQQLQFENSNQTFSYFTSFPMVIFLDGYVAELIMCSTSDWLGGAVPHGSTSDFFGFFLRHQASRLLTRKCLSMFDFGW